MNRPLCTFAAVCLGVIANHAAALNCPADLNNDLVVDGTDLASLLAQWNADGAADFNGDGIVNGADLATLLAAWGDCPILEYPAPVVGAEAHQIALETLGALGPLFPSEELQQRVEQDLAAIRAFEPSLATEGHTPAWAPTQILAQLDMKASQEIYQCLLAYYSAGEDKLAFGFYIIDFPGPLNVLAAADDFNHAPNVSNAQPDALLGGENFYTVQMLQNGNWRWTVDDGYFDCFDGCDCHRFFVFETTPEGDVELISFNQVGPSYCNIK